MFIPTGDNIVMMSLPINILREKAESSDCNADDIWMISIVDRFKNRPNDSTFNNMCIATFASEYRVLARSEKCRDRIQLNNDCGFDVKRTKTKPAVIRYARFSETKTPELFYQSILQLFWTVMLNSDIEILKRCETGEVSSALHIFPTNRQVNEHNDAELLKTRPEYDEIEAQDFVNDKKQVN